MLWRRGDTGRLSGLLGYWDDRAAGQTGRWTRGGVGGLLRVSVAGREGRGGREIGPWVGGDEWMGAL